MSTSAWIPIAEGEAGIRQIVNRLQRMKDYYGALPAIRAAALAIAGTRVNNDQQGHVDRLAEYVRRGVVYQADPYNAEFTQTPDVLLLQINRRGFARGDCDDHVLLFASLAESLGVFTDIVGVVAPGGSTWNHVIVIAYPNEQPQQIDLCAKEGWQPVYHETLEA